MFLTQFLLIFNSRFFPLNLKADNIILCVIFFIKIEFPILLHL